MSYTITPLSQTYPCVNMPHTALGSCVNVVWGTSLHRLTKYEFLASLHCVQGKLRELAQGGQRGHSWRAFQLRLQGFNVQVDGLPVLLDQGASLAFRLDEAYVTKQLLARLRRFRLLANRIDRL